MEEAEIWVRCLAAALTRDNAITVNEAAAMADKSLEEFNMRWRRSDSSLHGASPEYIQLPRPRRD